MILLLYFRPKISSDVEYVTIEKADVCQSTVGFNRGKPKYLRLSPENCSDREIFHELMHVIGILHEHQRPDR